MLMWAKFLRAVAYKEPWGYSVNFWVGMFPWDTFTLTR